VVWRCKVPGFYSPGKRFSLLVIFALKVSAVPVFFILYQQFPRGFEHSDSGKFFNDVQAMNELAGVSPCSYLRMLFGLQDNNVTSGPLRECLDKMWLWNQGTSEDFLYNDNRIIIRLHSLLSFIAFDSWFVHALFCCVLSFMGVIFLLKAWSREFEGNELLFVVLGSFFPSLWLYTGGFLKEGLCIFVMGSTALLLTAVQRPSKTAGRFILLALLFLLSFLLKPHILLTAWLFFGSMLLLRKKKHRWMYVCVVFVTAFFLANAFALLVKGKSVYKASLQLKHDFKGAEQGGIFLSDGFRFLRLDYDTTLIRFRSPGKVTIAYAAPFTYWEDSHHNDSLHCKSNADTTTVFNLVDLTPAGRSNIEGRYRSPHLIVELLLSAWYGLCHPFFFNAGSSMQWLASFENFFLLLCLLFVLLQLVKSNRDTFLPLLFVLFALLICVVAGFIVSNTGTILRYRAPAVVFIGIAAIYFFPSKTGRTSAKD
jgi:hypothetical protein